MTFPVAHNLLENKHFVSTISIQNILAWQEKFNKNNCRKM